ncbi:acyl carrier protein [Nocardia sp. CDC159]|uniref:Acyl carrier protein n=1 Tax=Nocardia pulmonis TaxID=2951408 RepID=A0A9X2E606_9NOCA|nr:MULTISPECIES: acyl carrier protein [Nocardia]MCM6774305.1 acyl carrier protein [Nocardia pulmonis]MCM6787629.1 acyl carrier protein [Nocardia sp. CDC159]
MAESHDIEQWVVETCRNLGLAVTGPDSDFFALGGTSLSATRLIAQVEERFGEDALPPEELYERSTMREIAAAVAAHARSAQAG